MARNANKIATRYTLHATRNKQRIHMNTSQKRGVLLSVVMILCGLILIFAPKIRMAYQSTLLQPPVYEAVEVRGPGRIPAALFIPGLIDIGIEPAIQSSGGFGVSQTQVTYLPISSSLGNGGNVILYGHNLDGILGKLDRVKIGDQVTLIDNQGTEWNYQVLEKVQVKPSQTQWLEPVNRDVLTIYTCAGFLDRERLVIRAEMSR